jgi:hypothetical protein
MKRASIELSVNFIVVMIISVVLLGIGIKLMATFVIKAEEFKGQVSDRNQEQLQKMLYKGQQVTAYPTNVNLGRGKYYDFGIGISNELGIQQNFYIKSETVSVLEGGQPTTLYKQGPYNLSPNKQTYAGIRVTIPKNASSGTNIINVYVCNGTTCCKDCEGRYGELQKIYINVI